jgi:hypothetical protein
MKQVRRDFQKLPDKAKRHRARIPLDQQELCVLANGSVNGRTLWPGSAAGQAKGSRERR